MKRIPVFVSLIFIFTLHAGRTQNLIEGRAQEFVALANSPGFCVNRVDPGVVLFRVECIQPKFQGVIWEGLPRVGDFIDTSGANWVRIRAYFSFAPGVNQPVGQGVQVRVAEWGAGESSQRKTNTIRTSNPSWDFSLRGRDFCSGGQPASDAGYGIRPGSGTPPPIPTAATVDLSLCREVAGTWRFQDGGFMELDPQGVAVGFDRNRKETNRGRWICLRGTGTSIEISWNIGGWRDTLRLSPDSKRLEGQNQVNTPLRGERVSSSLAQCQAAAGGWRWFNGGRVELDQYGNAIGFDRNAKEDNRGSWRCLGGMPIRIEITWQKGGWVDTLTLSSDQQRLEGQNQAKSKISGERIKNRE